MSKFSSAANGQTVDQELSSSFEKYLVDAAIPFDELPDDCSISSSFERALVEASKVYDDTDDSILTGSLEDIQMQAGGSDIAADFGEQLSSSFEEFLIEAVMQYDTVYTEETFVQSNIQLESIETAKDHDVQRNAVSSNQSQDSTSLDNFSSSVDQTLVEAAAVDIKQFQQFASAEHLVQFNIQSKSIETTMYPAIQVDAVSDESIEKTIDIIPSFNHTTQQSPLVQPQDCLENEYYMQILKRIVFEEEKVITFKSLSKILQCHENIAKQMLYNFVKQDLASKNIQGVVYLVSGLHENVAGTDIIRVQLIRKCDLKKTLKKLIAVFSCHVYSVQKSGDIDFNYIQRCNFISDSTKHVSLASIENEKAIQSKPIRGRMYETEMSAHSLEPKHEEKVIMKRTHQTSIKDFSTEINEEKKTKFDIDSDHKNIQDLWVDKYKPTTTTAIVGQQEKGSNLNKLKMWLKNWKKSGKKSAFKAADKGNGAWAKCALLSGPPGVGKTLTAYLVSKDLGYDVVEMNTSNTRSKRILMESMTDTLNNKSVSSIMKKKNGNKIQNTKRVLLMEDVDGMTGNEDRGGIVELIKMIKLSRVPVIVTCNERNNQKIRSLASLCFDLRFSRPKVEQIRSALMSVCFKEKIQIMPEALSEIIVGCGQDMRQVLHHLTIVKAGAQEGGRKIEVEQAKKDVEMSGKTSVKLGPWNSCIKVFNKKDQKIMSFNDKLKLYYHDYNLAGLFVQENYLGVKPASANNDKRALMQMVSKAADSMAEGDLVEKLIRSDMNWGLLSIAAVFCSVLPGECMSGLWNTSIKFPMWLGNQSKKAKFDRILQELQVHTKISAGVSKGSLVLEHGQGLRNHIVGPLVSEGTMGVEQAVSRMHSYSLMRNDLDNLLELTKWPDYPDIFGALDRKTKGAFTRKYKKEGVTRPQPYSIATTNNRQIDQSDWGEGMLIGDELEDMEEIEDDGSTVEMDKK